MHTPPPGQGFEWDPIKAWANLTKHDIEFADSPAVFEDERAVTIRDELNAVNEPRFLTLGRDVRGRLVVVSYTWQHSTVRIFAAREATSRERRQYLEKKP